MGQLDGSRRARRDEENKGNVVNKTRRKRHGAKEKDRSKWAMVKGE